MNRRSLLKAAAALGTGLTALTRRPPVEAAEPEPEVYDPSEHDSRVFPVIYTYYPVYYASTSTTTINFRGLRGTGTALIGTGACDVTAVGGAPEEPDMVV